MVTVARMSTWRPSRSSGCRRSCECSAVAVSRRKAVASTLSALVLARGERASAKARYDASQVEELTRLFTEAIKLSNGETEPADEAWTRIIDFAPDTSAAWSNRGTFRLQRGLWNTALEDLEQAVALEGGAESADGYLMNNLGNAFGANGRWDDALKAYKQSALTGSKAGDEDLAEIADANHGLGLMQVGRDEEALDEFRRLLRRDANFLDMRAAETAALWAQGDRSGAEAAWTQLQTADEGGLYPKQLAIARVQGRWPPRCTAALSAFLTVKAKGDAMGYDGKIKTYDFTSAK